MTAQNCSNCKYELLNATVEPCVSCLDPGLDGLYRNWQPPLTGGRAAAVVIDDVPKHVIPDETTQHALRYCHDQPSTQHMKSTLELVCEATEPAFITDSIDEIHQTLSALKAIIARMLCRQPLSVQLEILGLQETYQAIKEGTENG